MNYTREPIIETVISPKEGCKLVVRNSKGGGQEEYFVDSIEVVSFGNAIFYRSLERPKSFLVPASDYEVIEVKETKMVLKNVGIERSIKIGGGKEPSKQDIEKPKRKKQIKKKQAQKPSLTEEQKAKVQPEEEKGGGPDEETHVSSSIIRRLFPPPPTLIKEKLNHYKSSEKLEGDISKEIVTEEEEKKIEKEEIKENIEKIEDKKELQNNETSISEVVEEIKDIQEDTKEE